MAWLRVDDGFTKHPKFEGWPKSLRWDWLEAMEYCARYRTRGRLPNDLSLLPRAVTAALLKRAEASGWCARGEDGALWINDWETFNPPRGEEVEAAVEAALAADPDASSNAIARQIGGNRNLVLDAIRRYRSGSGSVSRSGTGIPVPEPVSRAQPVPSRPKDLAAAANGTQDEHAAAAINDRLQHLGLTPVTADDAERAQAWLNLADEEAHTNPAGYVRSGLDSGEWPSARARKSGSEPAAQPWTPERRRDVVEGSWWRLPEDELEHQLAEHGAEGDELVELLDLAADLRRGAAA